MPRQKTFDKKTSTTYALVHRPQHDPLIHDSEAPSQVFKEIPGPSAQRHKKSKIKQRGDLEEEFGLSGLVRENEGEAAEYGIYYDDSNYDYMQHMRELGGTTESVWVESATDSQQKKKDKKKQTLEDALRETSLEDDDLTSEGGMSFASSQFKGKQKVNTYQNQQDVPDELAGFQPDMDPRLREVLEALDDNEYASDDDDLFAELAGEGGEVVDQDEWAAMGEEDEDGWESDDTTKPSREYKDDADDRDIRGSESANHSMISQLTTDNDMTQEEGDGDWFEEFTKSKGQTKQPGLDSLLLHKGASKPFDTSSAAFSSASQFGKRKKRKGALTSNSGFSMTSSALARTEALSVMDERFEKYAESYMEDLNEEDEMDDSMSLASGMTSKTGASRFSSFGGSQAPDDPQDMPANFDTVLDDFLSSPKGAVGKKMKKGGKQGNWGANSGMAQLDEVRNGLGPARLSTKNRPRQPV